VACCRRCEHFKTIVNGRTKALPYDHEIDQNLSTATDWRAFKSVGEGLAPPANERFEPTKRLQFAISNSSINQNLKSQTNLKQIRTSGEIKSQKNFENPSNPLTKLHYYDILKIDRGAPQ
jgi:hypothetical protein